MCRASILQGLAVCVYLVCMYVVSHYVLERQKMYRGMVMLFLFGNYLLAVDIVIYYYKCNIFKAVN